MKKIKHLFLVFQFLTALSSYSQVESTLVYPGTNGRLVYANYANNYQTNENNTLPDFSNVGYMDGAIGVPVGEVPVKMTLYPTPSGEDRTRIQGAIDQVCAMPLDANGFRGAVLLKNGTYRLNDGTIPVLSDGMGYALRIWASGVVLRGEGQGADGTILYSDFALNHTMITLEPFSQSTSETNLQRITDAYVGTGAKTFTVANASNYAVGDNIIVKFTPNATWFSDLKVDENGYILYVAPPAESDYWNANAGAFNIGFKRKIIAKNGNTITIDCSIVQPMQTLYGGGQITKYTTTGRLNKCGVEDLRIVGVQDGGCPDVSSNGNRLRVGIRPRFLDNSWIHGVTVTRTSESAVMTWGVMNLTVQECAYIDPRGTISGGWRYSFSLDAGSTRVLFQRCYSDYGRHDFVTHARMPGPNVFVDCYSANGLSALGPHYRWAAGTLFDNIKAPQTYMAINLFDLSNGHGWCGAQTVGWNLECEGLVNDASRGSQNFLIGSIGAEYTVPTFKPANYPGFIFRGYWERSGPAGVHVNTRSLYYKQLEDRLGADAVANITIPEQRTGNIYNKLARWAGNGSLANPIGINKIISTCDSNCTWTSSNTLTENSTDKKVGTASLQSVGLNTNDFTRVFSPPINTGSTIANGNLQFWYFVSDISSFGTGNQVELGSGGAADTNEFNWNISIATLQNGWNLITLPFSTASITGGTPDLSAINWFRIYRTKTASVTTKIDHIIADGTLNTNTNIFLSGVSVFPNPLKHDKLSIKVDGANESEIFKVTISNIQGQVIYQTNFSGKNFIEINTAGLLKSAVYLVSVQSGQKISTSKLIVQ